ncbi:unnamed protein product [Caenorhabditis bovis]|uniref:Saposin B-type domain-containing protein n=1 Tax=Caenorhabditis bovis TaxID=2654633 RepID=A0A8S1EK51_9PELO|nr:unnamed protein product [Caenorhabditis bovis]
MHSAYLITLIVSMVVLTNCEGLYKDKLSKHGMMKEKKDTCLLTRSPLGCACSTCKDVVSFTRMLILNHVPEEEEVLDKVCRRIFGDDKRRESFCEDIVKSELPEIIKYVKSHVEPKQVCAKFC